MAKFIAILSDRDLGELFLTSQSAAQKVMAALNRRGVRKVLALLPHVVMFDFDGARQAAFDFLTGEVLSPNQLVLLETKDTFLAQTPESMNKNLSAFFSDGD